MIPKLIIRTFTKYAFLMCVILTSLLFNCTSNAKHILIYGDSLSAAYGMNPEQGWVALLDESLGDKHKVSNASISGETSAGGLARLSLTLDEIKPDVVVIALGANDGLRGYSTEQLSDNLNAMVMLIKDCKITPVIAGISIPPSYGPRYINQLRAVFPQVANNNEITFIDLFREDFLTTDGYTQTDGLHPTAITQPIIRDTVQSFLVEQGFLN